VPGMASSGDYNRDQWITLDAVRKICGNLEPSELKELRDGLFSYLEFREEVDRFFHRYFASVCEKSCFETGLSACCGFESIITFFADHAINYLLSSDEEIAALFEALERRNETGKCVYLGEAGCLWHIRPVSCAMFLCSQSKEDVFGSNPNAGSLWQSLLDREKDYTRPTKRVLFDDVEKYFLKHGVESPHLYFHQSPGLLRLKAGAGL
jgi:hypothetical protein